MQPTTLVTGGAGYIGSHTVVKLIEAGHKVVIADDLSNASAKAVDAIEAVTDVRPDFHKIDLANQQDTLGLFADNKFDSVIHFAGSKAVGESVEKPLMYYMNNVGSTLAILDAMRRHDVRDLVFSSSATVYGVPEEIPLLETSKTGAINPYGRTKQMIEEICGDLAETNDGWRLSMLRYFNPVGAHESGQLGEDPKGIPNNLVPFVMQVAVGRRESVSVYGNDWDTPDGTGVRDYIHVNDLADGHVKALEHLPEGWDSYNLGTGTGSSVLEVIAAASKASDKEIPYNVVDRRPGDIATSLADPSKANEYLKWSADKTLDEMMEDSWRWQSNNPNGFED